MFIGFATYFAKLTSSNYTRHLIDISATDFTLSTSSSIYIAISVKNYFFRFFYI